MTPLKFSIDGEQRFVAAVVVGDSTATTRLWVCLAPEEMAAGAGWIGCWSSGSGKAENAISLRLLLEDLRVQVAGSGRMGPFGPYLDDHLFFDGWDAWGSGIPAPLADLVPADVLSRAEICESVGNVVDRLFARDQ
jgi:hypothetical protein